MQPKNYYIVEGYTCTTIRVQDLKYTQCIED